MDEDKVRELLGRYRPVDPPHDLRAVVLRPPSQERVWPWAAAAAALLAATVAIQVATTSALGRIVPPSSDPANALAEAMGGDEEARKAAQLIVSEQIFQGGVDQRDELEELINASR